MPDDRLATALRRALLALRVTLGLFLLQWGVEKFVVPENTVGIWDHFYGIAVPAVLGYLFGAAEIGIALCLFWGCSARRRTARRSPCTPSPRSSPGGSSPIPGATR
jgi:uncharacterized membrane protein YphA (DoxX/SURF4 family)